MNFLQDHLVVDFFAFRSNISKLLGTKPRVKLCESVVPKKFFMLATAHHEGRATDGQCGEGKEWREGRGREGDRKGEKEITHITNFET
jgi:hypothetical protein